jgi:hypothetical protein
MAHKVTTVASPATSPTTNTQLIAAGARQTLRLHNRSANTTVYVTQNNAATSATAGNKTLLPGDTLEVDGAAATAAWYMVADAGVPSVPTVDVHTFDFS